MNSQDIKEYIYDNDKIEYVLEQLGHNYIKWHDNKRYLTCTNVDGDNQKAIVVYNNDFFNIINHTRQVPSTNETPDIIDLICFDKKIYFTQAIKWLCEILELDYYSDPSEDLPDSIKWTKMIQEMITDDKDEEENVKLKPISEQILKYYYPYVNDMFLKDGISYEIQKMFEVGYDLESNRITIPIRDELGTLVGVKGRLFKDNIETWESKYLYLERCAKNKILYGLDKTMQYIKEKNECIVPEAEKSSMQGVNNGVPNMTSIGGHILSKYQVEKLTRLGVGEIILCYDEDAFRYKDENGVQVKVSKEEMLKAYKQEVDKFIPQQKVSVMIDLDGTILSPKQSPTDDFEKFWKLYENRIQLR